MSLDGLKGLIQSSKAKTNGQARPMTTKDPYEEVLSKHSVPSSVTPPTSEKECKDSLTSKELQNPVKASKRPRTPDGSQSGDRESALREVCSIDSLQSPALQRAKREALTRESHLALRKRAIAVLDHVLKKIGQSWGERNSSAEDYQDWLRLSVAKKKHYFGFPPRIGDLLESLIDEGLPSKALTEAASVNLMEALVDTPLDSSTASTASSSASGTAFPVDIFLPSSHIRIKEVEALHYRVSLLRCMWFLAASQWRSALEGGQWDVLSMGLNLSGASAKLDGWSYPVYYYMECGAVQPFEDGPTFSAAELGRAVKKWEESKEIRQRNFHLLACLYNDCQILWEEVVKAVQKISGNGGEAMSDGPAVREEMVSAAQRGLTQCLIPSDLVCGMHAVLIEQLHEKNFMEARQAYAELTLGNANWRLGLFSGGEVHMRRSMEKVERNAISHLLNNERAVKLLLCVREWVRFAEKEMSVKDQKWFFAPWHL